MAVLGILLGVGLALAGRYFHATADPRLEMIAGALPGINCGACGYAGCDGYAAAVAGGAAVDLCVPGGPETARKVARIMGVTLATERLPVRAFVHCQGGAGRCGPRYAYKGIRDCRAAHIVQAGPKQCEYGCLGYGTCAGVCPFGAIAMRADGIPIVDWRKCTGCGMCVRACPRNLLETLPGNVRHGLACSSQDRGKTVSDVCAVGCIACWLCIKVSQEGAIEKEGNLPCLTYAAGADYAAAMEKCPMRCYVRIAPPRVFPENANDALGQPGAAAGFGGTGAPGASTL